MTPIEPDLSADDVRHQFSWLPYDHTEAAGHRGVLVAVCDCGWTDLTNSGQGTGWDAATAYVEHVRGVAPMADQAERVRAIFDRQIAEAEANMEPSPMIDWLERLRAEVLAALLIDGEPS